MNPIGLLNLIFCALVLLRCARRRELTTVYWGAAFLFGGLPLAFPSLIHFEMRPGHVFADSVLYTSALFILAFNIMFAATAHRVTLRTKSIGLPVHSNEFTPAQLAMIRRFFWWPCVVFVIAAPVVIWMTGGSLDSIGSLKWTTSAELYEGQTHYGFVAANTWFMVFSFAVPFALLLKRHLTVVALLALAFVTTQVTGTRTYFLPAFISVATLLVLRVFTFRPRRTFPLFAGGLIFSVVVLVFAYKGLAFVAWARLHYDVASLAADPGTAWSAFSDTYEAQMDASAGAMLYSFEVFPSDIPYCNGLTYSEMALTPVPATLLRMLGFTAAKTNEFSGIILARHLYGVSHETRFASIHPTLWGDAYANFGPLGALLGSFWGLAFGGIERLLRSRQILCIIALPTYVSFVAVLVRGSMVHATLYFYTASMLIGLLLLLVHLFAPSAYRLAIMLAPGAIYLRIRRPFRPSLSNAPGHLVIAGFDRHEDAVRPLHRRMGL